MHLEYIYAVTKQKPIIVFMHDAPETRQNDLQDQTTALKDKFKEFRHQLQKEVEQVVTYKTLRDLELAVRSYMPQMLERYPVVGWVRPQNLQVLQDEIDKLKSELAKARSEQTTVHGLKEVDPFLTLPKVYSNEIFSFDYRMHAYQDGNFRELTPMREMSWLELVKVLSSEFREQMPEEFFSKVLNEHLNNTGLNDALRVMPRAHAVSRAQINIRALHTIKQQMRQNEWVVPVGRDDRQRMLWQMTAKALKLIEGDGQIGRRTPIL